ncbi:hypothetical protein [Sphaerisporangium sp. TRM90804]|uniref:hypothetical protein n=1 Tax=Sphaerisporangium sp. TRM90804 TaxID=3031113 RepID=UPI0024470548|nr:hypothetical protein [Sphaerisporangium sp. TRM90804]MDH2429378.1 hypothetical protein [Sphaerisporangium sp. TRM90804]
MGQTGYGRVLVPLLVVMLAGTFSACRSADEPPARSAAPPTAPSLPPAGDVWPDAFFETPARISGVRAVRPVAMLGEREVLLADPSSTHPVLVGYDPRTRAHRVLARVPEGPAGHRIAKAASGAGRVAWMANVRGDGDPPRIQIWVMPVSGGAPELLTEFPGQGFSPSALDGFEIADGHVVWWSGALVHRVPISGGAVRRVKTEGYDYMSSWPWAYDKEDGLLNLATGERRAVAAMDGGSRRCGAEWCVSELTPKAHELTRVVTQRVDGSGRTLTPGVHMEEALVRDRFGFFDPPFVQGGAFMVTTMGRPVGTLGTATVLYDRCTGRSALLDPSASAATDGRPEQIHLGGSAPAGPLLYWKSGGDRYTVLDLSRVAADGCSS